MEVVMMVRQLKQLRTLIKASAQEGGLVSIYLPVQLFDQHPELSFQRLWNEALELLKKAHHPLPARPHIPWVQLHQQKTQGIAFFYSKQGVTLIPLSESVPSRVVVATSFHLKPLIACLSKTSSRRLLATIKRSHRPYHGVKRGDNFEKIKSQINRREFKKMVVSLDEMLFYDPTHAGKLQFHHQQLNHKDDDVLDDLIELALKNRLRVGVVPHHLLPVGCCLLAA
jgi:hypothetical protein